MPRNISFNLTQNQFLNQTKHVTRRMGWKFLKPGDILNGCEKCQGLRKGEKINKLGEIRVVSVAREPLNAISKEDVVDEGFPEMSPGDFVKFFCETHKGCTPETEITRIKFEYLNICSTNYHVIGVLERNGQRQAIDQHLTADNASVAIESFENDGWYWVLGKVTVLRLPCVDGVLYERQVAIARAEIDEMMTIPKQMRLL